VNDFIEECSAFSERRHDDSGDKRTQAIQKLLLTPSLTNFSSVWPGGTAATGAIS